MNRELAEKYLSNLATPVEAEEVLKWFRTPEGEKYLLHKIINDVELLDTPNLVEMVPELQSDKIYQSVWTRIQESKKPVRPYSFHRNKWAGVFLKAAAAILVVVSAAYFSVLYENQEPEITEIHDPLIFQTGSDENRTLRLSDGTIIRMNAESELIVSGTYLRGSREITLNGEAYFEVVHDPDNPFIIHSNQSTVEVLGTEFNVRSYPGHNNVQVAVIDGKVSFKNVLQVNSDHNLILQRGQYGYLDLNTGNFETDDIAIENYLSWKNGSLVFEELTLAQVCQQLSRLYESECEFEHDGIRSLLVTAKLTDPSLDKTAEVIALTHNISHQKTGNRIKWNYAF
jgi:transmembrane sensor